MLSLENSGLAVSPDSSLYAKIGDPHPDCSTGYKQLSVLDLQSETCCIVLSFSRSNDSLSLTSDNNESDRRPAWKNLLFNYQNISESCLALTKANSDLRGENERLRQRSTWLDAQNKLLNRTSAQLMSVNLALSLESTELTEQIVNLTSTNLELAQEHQSLVQHRSEQEEEKLNMSQTIKHLVDTGTRQEEEARRLSELNGLLRDELFQLREKNEELLENNHKFDGEIKNLSEQVRALLIDDCDEAKKHNMQLQERVTKLQERSQNLSSTLTKERQEAAEREESRRNEMDRVVADMRSVKEAFHSLDLYCPVLHHQTKGTCVGFVTTTH